MKKILFGTICLALILIFSVEIKYVESRQLDVSIPEEIIVESIRQAEALSAYETLLSTFEKDCNGLPIYPNEYGGEYIDDASLVIEIVGLNDDPQYKIHGISRAYMQNSTQTNAVDSGDSGGSVYINDGSYKIQGSVSGHIVPASNTGIIHEMYISPIGYAIDTNNVGFVPKTN